MRCVTFRFVVAAFAASAIASASPVTISFNARVINILNVQVGNAAFNDFLTEFGLTAETMPDLSTEIPFSGTYTYDYPQSPLGGSSADWGVYSVSNIQINGRTIGFGTPSPFNTTLNVILSRSGNDAGYGPQFNGGIPPASDTVTRSMLFAMLLTLPPSTFATNALPPDISFFPTATGHITPNSLLRYFIQPEGGPASQFGGGILWGSTGLAAAPEPSTFGLAGVVCLLIWGFQRRNGGESGPGPLRRQ